MPDPGIMTGWEPFRMPEIVKIFEKNIIIFWASRIKHWVALMISAFDSVA